MRYQIGVIGSSQKSSDGEQKAKQVGREIAKNKCKLLTGACTGLPFAAIKGAKEEKGMTAGISPASSQEEHLEKYQYPVNHHDYMIYTGLGYKGRNVILVRSCDAVIAVSGRMGTLNELTIAYGEKKIMGLLKGLPGVSDEFEKLAEKTGRAGRIIITSDDPKKLVKNVIQELEKD